MTDEDRRSLTAGKELRLIVIPSTAATPSAADPLRVKLYSGPLEIIDSDFGTGTSAIKTAKTSNPADNSNADGSSFATVINRFNSGARNTVLKAGFTPVSALDIFTLNKSVSAIPLSSYNQFSFFIYAPLVPVSSSESLIRVILNAPAREGAGTDTACEFDIEASVITAGEWHRITIDLADRKILKDGTALTDAEARIIKLDRSLSPTHLDVSFEKWPMRTIASGTDETAWTVYLDELFLQESNPVYTGRNETNFSWQKRGPLVSAGKIALVSDTSFSVRTTSSITAGSTDPVIEGSIKGDASLLMAKLNGSLSASSGADTYLETTFHDILIPFGPLTAKEDYSVDLGANTLQREESLTLTGLLDGMFSVSEKHGGMKLERKAGASLSPRIPETPLGDITLSADSLFSQSGITPIEPLKKTSWGNTWIQSFPLLLSPGEGDADSRKGTTGLKFGWGANSPDDDERVNGLSGIMMDASGQSLYSSHGQTDYGSIVSFKATAPITFRSTILTPEWNRTVEENKIFGAGGSYFTDSQMLAASFARQRWLYSVPPVADLFKTDMKDTIRDYGTWSRIFTNQYGLGWKRPSSGMLSDLYIPSTINASIQRKTETDASTDNSRDLWSAPVKAGFQALNIAGSFGILQLFSWYEQDEIDQLYGWTPHWGAGSFLWSVDTWHSITLFFRDQGTVSTENTFHYDSSDVAKKKRTDEGNHKADMEAKGKRIVY